jgi:dihydrofolate reductase
VAAIAENGVIGHRGSIPWHLPEDFKHFRRATLDHTVLMGRTTFESIGRPLPQRSNLVVTRDPAWRHAGVRVVHDLQSAVDAAEDLPGDLMVIGGAHVYAALLPAAHLQILSRVRSRPAGDAVYPPWDESEWLLAQRAEHEGFDVETWTRKPREERTCRFDFPLDSALPWWSADWASRLARAVDRQRQATRPDRAVNWAAVRQAAMQVIIEAAEDYARRGEAASSGSAREVRLNRHLSLQDIQAIQGALLHWSDFVSPRGKVG